MTDPLSIITFSRQIQVSTDQTYEQVKSRLQPHDKLYVIVFSPDERFSMRSVGAYESDDESMRVYELDNQESFDRMMIAHRSIRIEWYVQTPRHRLNQLGLQEHHWEASTASNRQVARDHLHAIRQEKRILQRQLAGKPEYPWWSPKRWLR